ncbi:MAG: ECF transporter S component [Symbiobacteriaceae bacterium]|nr:ECF transporter S component [Symbiobacteriaceae bacterium]
MKSLVSAALLTAAVVVATGAVPIPLPGSGYGNAGDAFVIMAGCILSPFWGGLAAGIGSMLADLLLASAAYAPATLVIKGLMAIVAGFTYRRLTRSKVGLPLTIGLAALLAETIMVLGYFLYELFLFDGVIATVNLMGNVAQGVVGLLLAVLLLPTLLTRSGIIDMLGFNPDESG